MTTLSAGALTYTEWALRRDPTGRLSVLVNMLSKANEILDDMLAVECQSGNSFEYTQVVRLPTPALRQYNAGVPRTFAGVGKLMTTCEEYGDWVVMDSSLARLGGNLAELRTSETMIHAESLSQSVASDLFYGNRATNVNQFTGLANIYNTVNTATSAIAGNVIDGQGTGSDNCSLWLIYWSPKQIHTIFPQGLPTGVQMKDFGELPVMDSNNNEFPGYRTWLQWNIGLAVHDWRYGVRMCNIDVSDLAGATPANIINGMVRMVNRTPTQPAGVGPVQNSDSVPDRLETGRAAFYCDRTLRTWLDIQALNKTNNFLQNYNWDGKVVTAFRGIPIRTVDALLDTESRVV